MKNKHEQETSNLKAEIASLKKQLLDQKQLSAAKYEEKADGVWQKIEIPFTEKNIQEAILQTKEAIEVATQATTKFAEIIQKDGEQRTQMINELPPKINERLELLRTEVDRLQRNSGQQLDSLATIVNNLEDHYKAGLPEHLKNISLTSDMSFASPTMLNLALRDGYLNIQREYDLLRSQLSQESNSYISANNELKDQVRNLTHNLSEMAAKFSKEKEEKDKIMHLLQGQDKEAFDAIRFHSVLEQNEEYKRQIKKLTDELIIEKHLKINELFDEQDALKKITTLNQELSTLGNVNLKLMEELQQLKQAYALKVTEKDRQIAFLEDENKISSTKLVSPYYSEPFGKRPSKCQNHHSSVSKPAQHLRHYLPYGPGHFNSLERS